MPVAGEVEVGGKYVRVGARRVERVARVVQRKRQGWVVALVEIVT